MCDRSLNPSVISSCVSPKGVVWTVRIRVEVNEKSCVVGFSVPSAYMNVPPGFIHKNPAMDGQQCPITEPQI